MIECTGDIIVSTGRYTLCYVHGQLEQVGLADKHMYTHTHTDTHWARPAADSLVSLCVVSVCTKTLLNVVGGANQTTVKYIMH